MCVRVNLKPKHIDHLAQRKCIKKKRNKHTVTSDGSRMKRKVRSTDSKTNSIEIEIKLFLHFFTLKQIISSFVANVYKNINFGKSFVAIHFCFTILIPVCIVIGGYVCEFSFQWIAQIIKYIFTSIHLAILTQPSHEMVVRCALLLPTNSKILF